VTAVIRTRPFRKGLDEETYVRIFNAAFLDYDDVRTVNLQEVQSLENAPSWNLDGLFFAEWNDQTAGMVQAFVDKFREEKKGFILSLAVLPEFRHRGIAKRMLSEGIISLKQRGMRVATAWAQTDRVACVHLYESFGFKRVRSSSLMKRSLRDISTVEHSAPVSLREAKIESNEDIALINKLENEAFKEHFNYRPVPTDETRYMLLEMPWWRRQKAWFAILDDRPVGYVIAGVDVELNREKKVKHGMILDIGVLKAFRRRGIGSTLIFTAARYLQSLEMENVLLYVDDQNITGAMKLYEKVGFKVSHKSAVYELQLV
jgi:mycothiol synthase